MSLKSTAIENSESYRDCRRAHSLRGWSLWHDREVHGVESICTLLLEDNWNVAAGASAIGTLQCVDAWVEDFRQDIAKNTVPTLIIHGDADRILPPDARHGGRPR